MPLQCIVLSDSIHSQHAIELILVSQNTRLESDSNDSRIMCILCKTKKLSILFTFLSEREQSIARVEYSSTTIIATSTCTPTTAAVD